VVVGFPLIEEGGIATKRYNVTYALLVSLTRISPWVNEEKNKETSRSTHKNQRAEIRQRHKKSVH